ncbi:MAG TPA: NAD(P)H-hydrate epimerase [Planctomycetota bacterium]|jgi:NAD(P)H-hydrate epimerase
MLYLSREQVRRVDRLAIEELCIPGVVLMENAGRSVAEETLALARNSGLNEQSLTVAVLCGGGNNGGDGYVIARHLHNAGATVRIYSAVDAAHLTGDAAINRAIIDKMNLPCREILDQAQLDAFRSEMEQAQILIDALLGTGFSGQLRPHLAACIRRCNELSAGNARKVVAVDLPSGLDCDTGQPSDPTVRADLTVTFVAQKVGFSKSEAQPFLGRIVVAGIGTPPELLGRVQL